MNPNELKMYIALQPMIKKAMGKWQHGDMFWYNDRIKFLNDFDVSWFNASLVNDLIRIPLPIDPVNPERGLWGMVDWSKLRYEQWGPDGEMAIYKPPYVVFNEEMGIPVKDDPFIIDTPTTAILKALCDQEGV